MRAATPAAFSGSGDCSPGGVNGYQTVDWTDDRKENDNPRNGYRAAKGPISIQCHDATTDILFRNIRIGELLVEKK